MKQVFFGGLLVVLGLLMNSCNKTNYVSGVEWHVEDFVIDKWDYSNSTQQYDNNYYYADFNWPSLTKFVYTDGEMQAYVVTVKDGVEVQIPLPYIEHHEEQLENNEWMYYSTTYNVEYSIQGIRFTYQSSLFQYEDMPNYEPKEHKFRVVLQW